MTPEAQVAGVSQGAPLDAQSMGADGLGQNALTLTEANGAQYNGNGSDGSTAWSIPEALGLFNILVGLMLVAAFLFFFGGLTGYLSRLGMEGRVDGLVYMYRGVSVLFVLIVMLAIVNFLQVHTQVVIGLFAIVLIAFAIYAVVQSVNASKGGDDEH